MRLLLVLDKRLLIRAKKGAVPANYATGRTAIVAKNQKR